MSQVSSRYAEALLSLAPSPEQEDRIGEVLKYFLDALENTAGLYTLMFNPVISRQIKKETAAKLIEDDSLDISVKFLFLLVDKDRLSILSDIYKDYDKLKAQRRNILHITVFSAYPLDDAILGTVGDKYMRIYGSSSIQMVTHIDPSLLGGMRIQIGDIRIDGTLEGRLKKLRRLILE